MNLWVEDYHLLKRMALPDMGPSWYWMPEVFEDFFNDFDKKVNEYYKLERLDPFYKFFFKNKETLIPSEYEKLKKLFDNEEKNSSKKLDDFLAKSKKKYDISMSGFIQLPNIQRILIIFCY